MDKKSFNNPKTQELFSEIDKHFSICFRASSSEAKRDIKEKIYEVFKDNGICVKSIIIERKENNNSKEWYDANIRLQKFEDAKNIYENKIKLNFYYLLNRSEKKKIVHEITPTKIFCSFMNTYSNKIPFVSKRKKEEINDLNDDMPKKSNILLEGKEKMSVKSENLSMEIDAEPVDKNKYQLEKVIDEEEKELSELDTVLLSEYNEEFLIVRTLYLLGVPINFNNNMIISELKRKNIAFPEKLEVIKSSIIYFYLSFKDNNTECFIYKIIFPDWTMADVLLEKGLDFENFPVLILPKLKEKTLEELLIYHQAIVKCSNNEFSSPNFNISQEFEGLFRVFSNFGRIVDFNMDYYPNFIAITYLSCESVHNLVSAKEIKYVSSNNHSLDLDASYNQTSVPVRNLKNAEGSICDKFFNSRLVLEKKNITNDSNPITNNQSTINYIPYQNQIQSYTRNHNGFYNNPDRNMCNYFNNQSMPSFMYNMNQLKRNNSLNKYDNTAKYSYSYNNNWRGEFYMR